MQRIYIVDPENIIGMLPVLTPWLQKMARWSGGRRTVEDIVRRVVTREALLWVTKNAEGTPNGALVTHIEAYPRMRMLSVDHCAGERGQMDDIANEMYEALEKFSKFNQCEGVEFVGRPGWVKHVEKRGYKPKHVLFELRFAETAASA